MERARSSSMRVAVCLGCIPLIPLSRPLGAQSSDVKTNYAKSEHMIAMRDGVKLFTSVYAPRDTAQKYPILLCRTP